VPIEGAVLFKLSVSEIATLILSMSLNFITAWRTINFTLVLIKINYGQIGDQTGLFYTTNPVFYTSGNRFVRRTGTFGILTFSLVPSDNRNTRSTCPTSVFTGIGQRLMSMPVKQQSVRYICSIISSSYV
jgi:hypothetical protein